MNVDQIYQLHRDDAFADQFEAENYSTFLAMPFRDDFGYDPQLTYERFQQASEIANDGWQGARKFERIERVGGDVCAIVLTDEIIRRILNCHFFVADLTNQNPGVMLEVGIALALKPNARIALFNRGEGTCMD